METKVWNVDKHVENHSSCTQIADAAQLLKTGEVVAFPTETVYGLGANALSNEAVEKIFTAKGRPSDNPLIVHIGDQSQLSMIARELPPHAKQVMGAFWPGPLTLILPKTDQVATRVTANLDSVGVRMPDHPVALELIRQAGVPIAAPSANRSGRPSPTTAQHVMEDLNGRIAGIIDAGSTGVGVESTVLDVTVEPPMILRPGGITLEQLQEIIPEVTIDPVFLATEDLKPRSPGMKYTHYAPQGELWIVAGNVEQTQNQMNHMLQEAKQLGRKTGVLATQETGEYWNQQESADIVLVCGSRHDLSSAARDLYGTLRQFDECGVQFIVAEAFSREGLGLAVMNRLEKAAGGRIINV
ncbi:L-threonylcarbamoyladenylate synthase [Brevibacillus ginsengisoli]|uniref:L-threonylcarbamoyladenylate synthase n=1 Tax=Brevibacillus ginsengisoli TaxID=363854 RepID=UPI003CF0A5E7